MTESTALTALDILQNAHANHALITRAKNSKDEVKPLRKNRVFNALSLPLSMLTPSYDITLRVPTGQTRINPDTGRNRAVTVDYAYRISVSKIGENTYTLDATGYSDNPVKAMGEPQYRPNEFTCVISLNAKGNAWVLDTLEIDNVTQPQDTPIFNGAEIAKLANKTRSVLYDAPLGHLLKHGLIDLKSCAMLYYAYLREVASKGMVQGELSPEVASTLGSIVWGTINHSSSAGLYSPKELFTQYLRLDWSIIDHANKVQLQLAPANTDDINAIF